jgi:hypothetical protein
MHRLLGRPALTIDRRARNHITQPSSKPARPRNVTGQRPNGVQTTKNHIIVFMIWNIMTLDQGF